jgi:hypothetical protein
VDLIQLTVLQSNTPPNKSVENIILVPSSNPIKRKRSKDQADLYQISNVHAGRSQTDFWTVNMTNKPKESFQSSGAFFILLVCVSVLPVAIVGALSGFHKGHSTVAQRVWTMAWLSFGILGPTFSIAFPVLYSIDRRGTLGILAFMIFYAAPAVGGFVVVGQMLKSYGTCVNIT